MPIMKLTLPAALAVFATLTTSAPAVTGLEVMKEQENRHESKSEYSRALMTLTDKRGRKTERILHTWAVKGSDGLFKTLLKFSSPTDIRNVGLLTWEQAGAADDDQWLSLPATKQVKRITGGSKKNLFMGTDLAYEDMRAEELDAHTYEIVREESVGGKACWVIEATPSTAKEKKESGYSKRNLWISKDNYLTVKADFYGRSGKLEKQCSFEKPVKVKGQLWRNQVTRMHRIPSGSTTTTQLTKLKVDEGAEAALFTQQGLKRPVTDN